MKSEQAVLPNPCLEEEEEDQGCYVARNAETRYAYIILAGKCEVRRPFGRLRHKGKSSIMIDLRKILCNGVDWLHLTQDRDQWRAPVNTVMNL
jgi:hypothetical protein